MSRLLHDHAEIVLDTVQSASRAAVSPVAASWRRSALHHHLDPSREAPRECTQSSELQQLRDLHGDLLDVAAPVLDQVFRSVGRAGCGVILSEAGGVILDRRIGDADISAFADAGLIEGACWSEAREGTNGIGTCLFEGKTVIIHRDQHFASRNVGISCMDAPVYDPQGRLVAALDVSSCRDDHSPVTAEMIAALVRDAARRIERDYFCRHFAQARIVLVADDTSGGSALLAADRDDLVIGATRAARARFGLNDDTFVSPMPVAQLLGGNEMARFGDGDRAVLRQALARAHGNASEAARLLGIGRATLYRRMARAGLRPSGE